MKFTRLLTLFFTLNFLLLLSPSYAQFGNEWINYDQTYYKIKIGSEGIYRIDFQTLSDIGVPVSSLNPKNLQLFLNGEEQHIYISGEADEVFDSTDFIEFYGNKNDGRLDTKLYRSAEEQPNLNYSLYADTSNYFLTWNSKSTNKRINSFYDNNYTGKSSDLYFMHEIEVIQSNDYFHGIPLNNSAAQLFSEYTDGEGFSKYSYGSMPAYNIPTPAVYTTGPMAKIEVLAYSSNHNTGVIVDGYNHEFGISVKTKSNLLGSIKTLGYSKIELTKNINVSDLANTSRFFLGEVSYAQSAFNLSYFKLWYPRKLDLANNSTFKTKTTFDSPYLNFTNYPTAQLKPILFDLTNHVRIKGDKLGTKNVQFNLLDTKEQYLYLIIDSTNITSVLQNQIELTTFIDVKPKSTDNLLIISNKLLASGVTAYKEYRESAIGGNYNVHVVFVDDLYNLYSYGIEHPIAIKNYINSLTPDLAISHLLLLGKGQLYPRMRNNNALRSAYNLVPTIGQPASDVLFVSELDASSLKMKYAIGRIPARDNNQILIYLEKLKQFEANREGEWQKKILQLAGGVTPAENTQFKSFLNSFYAIASDTSLGATRTLISKNDPAPEQKDFEDVIQEELNNGVSLLSYFGHGAAQVTEISLGDPDKLNNFGKTSIFLFDGCALGNTFEDLSLAERYLFAEKKGVLGWIASSNYGLTFSLFNHTQEIYKSIFQRNYGGTIGESMKDALNYYGNSNNNLDIMEARQLFYQGDPTLRLFSPNLPDYTVQNISLITTHSISDSIELNAQIKNLAKAVKTNLDITLIVKNGSNQEIYRTIKTINAPYFSGNLSVNVPKDKLSGLVDFQIIIDEKNTIAEHGSFGETNNNYSYQHLFQKQAPQFLYPNADAILTNNYPKLVLQVPPGGQKTITIQWDSTPYFQSPIGSKILETNQSLINHQIFLPTIDNKDYYVRAKYQEGSLESEWSTVTFGVISTSSEGWTEGNRWKFHNVTSESLFFDTLSNNWKLSSALGSDYGVWSSGSDLGTYALRFIQINFNRPIDNWWPNNGVNLVAINPDNERRYFEQNNPYNLPFSDAWKSQDNSSQEYNTVGEPCGVYNYDLNMPAIQDSFSNFLSRIPKGYHLIMLNARNCNTELWADTIWSRLQEFGIIKLKQVKDGEPFVVFGTKGIKPGEATEYLPDYNDIVTPPRSQAMVVGKQLTAKKQSGILSTKSIGPASSWSRIKLNFTNFEKNDSFSLSLFGSNNNEDWKKIKQVANDSLIAIDDINPLLYPYLKFELTLSDIENRTPPNLNRWQVNYSYPSEGLINYDLNYSFQSDTVQEGQNIVVNLAFTNVSSKTYDSSNYIIYVRDENNNVDTISTKAFTKLGYFESLVTSDTISSHNRSGSNELFVVFNPKREIVEHYYDNNYLSRAFEVTKDSKNPLLDIVFDGEHILDNDIVSPNTLITLSALDENPYLFIDDISLFNVILNNPDGTSDTLNQSNSAVTFIPSNSPTDKAKFLYQAMDLANGDYTIEVSVKDRSNNTSNQIKNITSFRVVRESSISNLYPYPNPFTTNMKFVYTLTGAKAPDYFKVQILTLTGKVIREVTQSEFGEMKIGNNVSKFTWDGTDEFGDQLANGVYLYRVVAKIDGKEISKFTEEDGSEFFANGFGKIYLMR